MPEARPIIAMIVKMVIFNAITGSSPFAAGATSGGVGKLLGSAFGFQTPSDGERLVTS